MSVTILETQVIIKNEREVDIISVGIQGPAGAGTGIPIGGTTGQVLKKNSNTDLDASWLNESGGSGGVSDGDKGDITVSNTGTVYTIDNGVVSTAKMGGDVTAAGKALLDDANTAAQRTTLGLGTVSTLNVPSSGNAAAGEVVKGNDTRLTDARTPTTHSHVIADTTGLQAAIDVKEATANKGIAGGYASLDGGAKIPAAQLPDIAISDYLGSVATQVAMLALTGQKGDWAIRTDLGTTWLITGNDPTILAGWTQLSYPTAPVTSVAGRTGAVTLTKTDVGLSNVDNTSDADKPVSTSTQTALNLKVDKNSTITGATKTKITYDAKGLVTSGADATTADITDSTNKRYVTDAQQTVIGNTSGTNTGDNAANSLYSGLVSNATHTGDATGSTALTLATVNSNVGSFTNASVTVNAKGLVTAASNGTTPATEVFRTIAVSGQSDVVADSATDTLTLVAGSNVTITTNATSDTITIASTGGGGGSPGGSTGQLQWNNAAAFDGVVGSTITSNGYLTLAGTASTTGSPTQFRLTGAAHTTLTASTEATDMIFNLARTVQFATGAITTQRAVRIQAPTYSFVGASTITTAATLSISGAPVAGTNATLTNRYALHIESGKLVVATGTNAYTTTIGWTGNWGFDCDGSTGIVVSTGAGANYCAQFDTTSFKLAANRHFGWSGNDNDPYSASDVRLFRDASDSLGQRRTTTAQRFSVYNTYTDTSNYERAIIDWKTTANTLRIGAEALGTGTQRAMQLIAAGITVVGQGASQVPWTIKGAASQSANLAEWQNSSATVMASVSAAGKQSFDSTITAGGTTGAQTINKPSGTVNFAATASSLVVTNSLVTTSSIVMAVVRTNDTTAYIKNVVPASGSFTIMLGSAATSETSVGFIVYN